MLHPTTLSLESIPEQKALTSLGKDTQTVPPASISFLFWGRTLTTTFTELSALSPPFAPPLPLLPAKGESDPPAVEAGVGEGRLVGVRALLGRGEVMVGVYIFPCPFFRTRETFPRVNSSWRVPLSEVLG